MTLETLDWSDEASLNRAYARMERQLAIIHGKVDRGEPFSVSDLAEIAQWFGIAQGVVSERAFAVSQPAPAPGHRARVMDFYVRKDEEDRKACVLECLSMVSEGVIRHWVADEQRPLSALVGAAELFRRKLGPDPRKGVVLPSTNVQGAGS